MNGPIRAAAPPAHQSRKRPKAKPASGAMISQVVNSNAWDCHLLWRSGRRPIAEHTCRLSAPARTPKKMTVPSIRSLSAPQFGSSNCRGVYHTRGKTIRLFPSMSGQSRKFRFRQSRKFRFQNREPSKTCHSLIPGRVSSHRDRVPSRPRRGCAPKGSLYGWPRCKTMFVEGMAEKINKITRSGTLLKAELSTLPRQAGKGSPPQRRSDAEISAEKKHIWPQMNADE